MLEKELKRYQFLNQLADKNGTVILGGTEDKEIPLCELKQAFAPDEIFYNRSIENLNADNALEAYKACVSDLHPETVLLHPSKDDVELFKNDENRFEKKYCELINYIKSDSRNCRVALVSLKNNDNDSAIARLNKRLEYIADSQRCEYVNISAHSNLGAKKVASFLHSIGFERPLTVRRPVGDLAQMLFCE